MSVGCRFLLIIGYFSPSSSYIKVSHERWMSFFDRYDTKHGRSSKKELKLKTAKQLQHVLDTTVARMKEMIASPGMLAEQESDLFDKLEQIRIVLGRASFSGINRKVRVNRLFRGVNRLLRHGRASVALTASVARYAEESSDNVLCGINRKCSKVRGRV